MLIWYEIHFMLVYNDFTFSVTEVAPKNINKSLSHHECGFCGQTFESLKYLQIHLNICNNPKVNKYGPKSQHGKRKREDSRQSIPPIGKIWGGLFFKLIKILLQLSQLILLFSYSNS